MISRIILVVILIALSISAPRAQLSMMNVGGGDLGAPSGTPCTTTGLKFNLACNTQYLF